MEPSLSPPALTCEAPAEPVLRERRQQTLRTVAIAIVLAAAGFAAGVALQTRAPASWQPRTPRVQAARSTQPIAPATTSAPVVVASAAAPAWTAPSASARAWRPPVPAPSAAPTAPPPLAVAKPRAAEPPALEAVAESPVPPVATDPYLEP